jgi:hypothetical protein
MYFWRIGELKIKLLSASLTERETLPYFIVFLALTAVVPLFPSETMNLWDYLGVGWTALLVVIGTIYLYRRNGGDAGIHFVQRYFAIGWVATVRWTALVAPLFIVSNPLFSSPEKTTWYDFSYFAIAELVLYERIGHHIADVATGKVAI